MIPEPLIPIPIYSNNLKKSHQISTGWLLLFPTPVDDVIRGKIRKLSHADRLIMDSNNFHPFSDTGLGGFYELVQAI